MPEQWMYAAIRREIGESVEIRRRLLEGDTVERIGVVAGAVTSACANGGKVLVFGNGGSAADAQHVAAEFVGRFRRDRRPLPALALSADIASITAVANDYAFEEVFERQVEAHGVAGDVAIGLSTSGGSENVIRAIRAARRKGLVTVGLSGEAGRLRHEAEHALCIPSKDTARIQETYMLICHLMCEIVERGLFERAADDAEEDQFDGTVFIDRDGTINRKAPNHDYVKTVEEFELLPTAAEAIRTLNQARRRVIVVTNQRGIALGWMSEADLDRIHAHMRRELAASGANVDAVYYCPHDRGSCECRKPRVGMFLQAAHEHPGLRLEESAILGDSDRDMAAGAALGMVRVLVGPHQRESDGEPLVALDHRAPTLLDGVRWLLSQARDGRRGAEHLTGVRA